MGDRQTFFQVLKRFLEPAMYDKKAYILTIIQRVFGGFFAIMNIYFIKEIVGVIEMGDFLSAKQIALGYTLFSIVSLIIMYLSRNYRWIHIDNSITQYVYKTYISKFINLDNTIIEGYGTGKSISIIGKGIEYWSILLYDGTREIVLFFVTVIVSIFMIIELGNIYYFLAFLVLLIISFFVCIIQAGRTKPFRRKIAEKRIIYDRQLVKIIMSKFEILQNNRTDDEIKRICKDYNDAYIYRKDMRGCNMVLYMLPELTTFLIYISFLMLFIYINIPTSVILTFFLLVGYLRSLFFNLVNYFGAVSKHFVNVEKMWDFFDSIPEIKMLNSGRKFEYSKGNIEIINLSFSYTNKMIFENFSLNIKGGQVTALVGESGGGKTTLMKLLSGFLQSDIGRILIDGQNLNEINLKSYYNEIGYLSQEPSIFDGTIIENLTYSIKGKVDDKELEKAIRLSKSEFIYDYKEGLNTEIGERGIRLSGGQKQRLAIAKIFLKNPKIIFLDEPTSALDSFSEKLIQESFKDLFKGRTVVIIAHRLQTVKNASEIFVIEEGKILEKGTHAGLIKQNGIYKQMLDLQSGF